MTAGQRRFIAIQPLDEWPGKRRGGVSSAFRAKFTDTLDFLERELEHIGATEPTIQTMHHQDDVRFDGRLKADTRAPRYQGVILTFKRPARRSEYACPDCREGKDRYRATFEAAGKTAWAHKVGGVDSMCKDQNPAPVSFQFPADKYSDWKDNVRAVAMVLEGLRMIERHGVKSEAQYAGYKALPAAGGSSWGEDVRAAADMLARHADTTALRVLDASHDELEAIYRKAARATHTDHGGSHEDSAQVNAAMTLLRKHLLGQ